jgi:hypothetical protein
MLAVRIQVIDGARTFTLQDPQPCRLLPFHVLTSPDISCANDTTRAGAVFFRRLMLYFCRFSLVALRFPGFSTLLRCTSVFILDITSGSSRRSDFSSEPGSES